MGEARIKAEITLECERADMSQHHYFTKSSIYHITSAIHDFVLMNYICVIFQKEYMVF